MMFDETVYYQTLKLLGSKLYEVVFQVCRTRPHFLPVVYIVEQLVLQTIYVLREKILQFLA